MITKGTICTFTGKAPKSEILANCFADMGEKCGEILAEKNFADVRPSISDKVAVRNFTKNPRLGISQKGSPERCRFRFFPFSSDFFRFLPFLPF